MKNFVTILNNMVKAFPLTSSSILSFILVGMEKLVDINFECPCNGGCWNGLYFTGFFIVPAAIAYLVMMIIERDPEKKHWFHFISTLVPPLVWFIIVFFDGEYLDCALTYRNGKYVQMEGDPMHKWCKPLNNTEDEIQLLLSSKKIIVISQFVGIAGLILLSIILGVIVRQKHCVNKSNTQNGDSATNKNLQSSAQENEQKDEDATSAHNSGHNNEESASVPENDHKDEKATSAQESIQKEEKEES